MSDFDDLLSSVGINTRAPEPERPPEPAVTAASQIIPEPEEEDEDPFISDDELEAIIAENTGESTISEQDIDINGVMEPNDVIATITNTIEIDDAPFDGDAPAASVSNEEILSETSVADATASVEEEPEEEEQLLTPNSPTLTMDDSSSRFSGTEWYNVARRLLITVAGIGGIGSWASLILARLQPAGMALYDDDIVESANMSGQLFSQDNLGQNKTKAMYDTIHKYAPNVSVTAFRTRFDASSESSPVMICGFDNMEARKTYFNAWLEQLECCSDKSKCIFIDGRLSIDVLQVFCITGDDTYNIANYKDNYLFSSSEADATVCSMKQTTYLAAMIGGFITNLLVNWAANQCNPIIPYDLPFFTEYDARNMIFKTVS